MAQAYGSVAHPVDLGPFSRITGVHWNTDRYIAFRLDIARRSVVKNYPYPAAAIGEVVHGEQPWDWTAVAEESPLDANPTTPNAVEYITGFQYEYLGATHPGPGYGCYRQRNGESGWIPTNMDDVTGLPSLPDVHSLEPWTVVMCALGTTHTIFSWWPRAEYQPIGGEALPITVPTRGGGEVFHGVAGATLQMRGTTFTEGPLQGTGFFGGTDGTVGRTPYDLGTYYCKYGVTNVWTEAGDGMNYTFSPLSIDVSAIRVTYKGRTYRGIGAALVPDPSDAPTTPGNLWILTEREDLTP
ncbi:hypothetical protein [Mesorhizobium sp.]|uniref:hypothetical protein n=1 Tax=Mesorhizobium sp. TaxID=1871066 RepID=UPI000FE77FE5|nr:hypothetical protein [Mesorhizobium sp.]RWH32213.1 MAG: hypothetical protein EOQ76_03725 [Mesorhizobium sp.]RWH40839.1 MAG: hypothetical protein EOQ79_02670 [Mesorhizobium sp.]TIM65488.1 MAG: hypothetical protein E5Y52_16910 [Mesorhizobium sp.]TIR61462.1 MAG: hypothetical protein E5X22_04690 [Mesorhizobium sp.]TIR70644.1 MAG: hypothetical protein E5X24_08390 [Mesorhizobium sp.]